MQRRDFVTALAGVVGGGAIGFAARGASAAGNTGDAAGDTAQAGRREPHLIDPATFHAMRQFAMTDFGKIAYIERGSGPAAVFLHGLPLNGFQWRGALERLWPHRRCIALDAMGLGYSEIPEGQDLSPAAQARMVAAFLDTLGIDTVDLVASDSGCAVAQLLVAHHGQRVRTLLMTNGDIHENSPPPTLQPAIASARAGTFVEEVFVPQLADPSLAPQPNGLGGLCYTNPAFVTRELLEVYLRPLVSPELRVRQVHQFWLGMEPNPLVAVAPVLRQSRVPVRVVWGTADHFFPAESAQWLDRTLPNSRGIRWVEDARLFFAEEMPDLIAAEARRLWGVE